MKRLMMALLCLATWQVHAEVSREISWDELMPADEQSQSALSLDHQTPAGAQAGLDQVTLNTAMNGQRIRIPGFAVPLEGDDKLITQFLLVPYFGACIHVPPPPANQVILVDAPKGVPIDILWDAIWVDGPIKTTAVTTDMAQVGYAIKASSISIYESE
jgi:hypothetical protein